MINLKNIQLVLLSFSIFVSARSQDINSMAYEAYLNGSEIFWEQVVEKANNKFEANPTNSIRYERALAVYGLLNATMKEQNESMFDEYVDILEEDLDFFIDNNYRVGEAKALTASMWGYKIAYSPMTGMYYGPKSASILDEALELEPNSPIVQKMYANYLYFTPETWGGDKDESLEAFYLSNQLFENQQVEKSWMYLDNLAWIGSIYKKKSKKDLALETWQRALEIEPRYVWVSKYLIPSLN